MYDKKVKNGHTAVSVPLADGRNGFDSADRWSHWRIQRNRTLPPVVLVSTTKTFSSVNLGFGRADGFSHSFWDRKTFVLFCFLDHSSRGAEGSRCCLPSGRTRIRHAEGERVLNPHAKENTRAWQGNTAGLSMYHLKFLVLHANPHSCMDYDYCIATTVKP